RAYVEKRTQDEVSSHTDLGSSVHIKIKSFPFIPRLLLMGHVQQITASTDRISEGPVPIDNVQLALHDVRLDRKQTVRKRRVILESTGGGSMSGQLTAPALSSALGIKLRLVSGAVEVEVAGRTFRAQIAVRNGVLTLRAAGVTLPGLTIPLA